MRRSQDGSVGIFLLGIVLVVALFRWIFRK